MAHSLVRCVVVGWLTIEASAVLPCAAGGDCVHTSACPEDQVDARGCCRAAPDPNGVVAIVVTKPTATGCPRGMVRIPGGELAMGSRPGIGDEDEHPQHRVTLPGYCLDATEVTVAAYAACVAAGACTPAAEPAASGPASSCNGSRSDRQLHPINCVDWDQAVAYCTSTSKRLPSEAEWEYAAVGPSGTLYPWGSEPPSAKLLNACGAECRQATSPVGSFPRGKTPLGVFDLAGNVAEWTADLYQSYTGVASAFQDGPHRVVRGSSFFDEAAPLARGASRGHANPRNRGGNLGFRCARDL
jgi:formylglycine-generating enzyme required for sulfatase activity